MLHIIYAEAEVLLSKRKWTSWHEIQDAFGSRRPLGKSRLQVSPDESVALAQQVTI